MKALRKLSHGTGHVALVDIPVPTPGEGEVLLNVKSAGICGTDLHILHGGFSKVRPPVTLGHEFCGEVTQLGAGVDHCSPGDRVVVETEAFSCGSCRYCREGLTNICAQRLAYGYSTDGGFAPFAKVRASALHKLPDAVSFREGALMELLAVAIHAVMECGEIEEDDCVLITGPGPIGLMALQVAKVKGARVIVSGTQQDDARLDVADSMGADHIVKTDSQGISDKVGELTNGFGVQHAIECSGSKAAVNDCIRSLAKRGRIVQVGLYGSPIEIDLDVITLKEMTVSGAFAHNHGTWEKAVQLLRENRIRVKSLISKAFPLEEWQQGFHLSEEGAGLKYLLYSE